MELDEWFYHLAKLKGRQGGNYTPKLCTLARLTPRTYTSTVARVVRVKHGVKADELGSRPYSYGILEDKSSRVSFLSYKPFIQFDRDAVFRFENAYVHEFEDGSLLLVLTEHSRIRYLAEENPSHYYWKPRIGEVRRPPAGLVNLSGIVSRIYSSSGLVRRCDTCGWIMVGDTCPKGHRSGYHWTVRAAGKLSDPTGSIDFILTQHLTCKLLGIPVSEIQLLAKIHRQEPASLEAETFQVEVEKPPLITEAVVVEDPLTYRASGKLIVPDKYKPKIYFPPNVKVGRRNLAEERVRQLNLSDPSDRRLLLKLAEKALELEVEKLTGQPKIHGIHLVEKPVQLYGCEQAKLYLGFEANLTFSEDSKIQVEIQPQALVRESILDYVRWRRRHGASAHSIRKTLLKRPMVAVAPGGNLGRITDVQFRRAGEYRIPVTGQTLPEFWRLTYGVNVDPEEKPLLTVRLCELNTPLTYPPSCVFFSQQETPISSATLRYVYHKKLGLAGRAVNIATQALQNLNHTLGLKLKGRSKGVSVQRKLFQEVREKLYGRRMEAKGSIVKVGGRICFLPKTIEAIGNERF